jgi:hypothetical protein
MSDPMSEPTIQIQHDSLCVRYRLQVSSSNYWGFHYRRSFPGTLIACLVPLICRARQQCADPHLFKKFLRNEKSERFGLMWQSGLICTADDGPILGLKDVGGLI